MIQNNNSPNIMKSLDKLRWMFSKGTETTMPNLSKDGFKLFFSEYDTNNFFIPIGNPSNPQLFWTNSLDEIVAHYDKFVAIEPISTIEPNLNQT